MKHESVLCNLNGISWRKHREVFAKSFITFLMLVKKLIPTIVIKSENEGKRKNCNF